MAKHQEAEFEDNPPDPGATIEALRSLGYSTEAAIADLIDNSVAAGATVVDVRMQWAGADTWCAVVDNGHGMTENELVDAMRIGAKDPLADRGHADLGRFGLGLKTASFSQARELTVATRRTAQTKTATRVWDLDHVRTRSRWEMRRKPTAEAAPALQKVFSSGGGTAVLWRYLTRVVTSIAESDERSARDDFLRGMDTVDRHLDMTFGRLLSAPSLAIRLNGHVVKPWDPFLTRHPATQQLAPETLRFKGHSVTIRPYVLPHMSKLSEDDRADASGPNGWNAQQGYYVYRRDRLIAAGDWLDRKLSRTDDFNLARLVIDVPAELDHDWGLDVKKTSVIPPRPLAKDLTRLAELTRRAARKAQTSRGVELKPRHGRAAVQTVWTQIRTKGDVEFHINRQHPLVGLALRDAGPNKRHIENLLRVAEQTIPVPYLPVKRTTARVPLDDESVDRLYRAAEDVYELLLQSGRSRADAIEVLRRTEPFDGHPAIVEQLVRKA